MSNVNRPTIPAEVADTIEGLRDPRNGPEFSNEKILTWAIEGDSAIVTMLRKIPFDTLLAALVNGYEREKPPEDARHVELRKEYVWRNGCVSEYSIGMADGIRYAVAMLGVKIEGVNA